MLRATAAVMLALLLAPTVARAETYTRLAGGRGGGPFTARCDPYRILAGVEIKTGDDVDAIRPLCRGANLPDSPANENPRTEGPMRGGNGGGAPHTIACHPTEYAVRGMVIGHEGERTRIVNNIQLVCGLGNGQPSRNPTGGENGIGLWYGPRTANHIDTRIACPPGQVAVGIHGRHGIWLDALGLICGAPTIR